MPRTRITVFGLSMVMIITVLSASSSAQVPRPLRWMGQGFSDGYHRCTPGPDSDYYNPYSAHNSLLISQNPEAYKAYPNRYPAPSSGPIRIGVPFSVYAGPEEQESLPNPSVQPIPDSQPRTEAQPQQNLENLENLENGELIDDELQPNLPPQSLPGQPADSLERIEFQFLVLSSPETISSPCSFSSGQVPSTQT